jgi:hypothetical protein
MANFMIGIECDEINGTYTACFVDGTTIPLAANTYQDAVLEADLLNNEIDYFEFE